MTVSHRYDQLPTMIGAFATFREGSSSRTSSETVEPMLKSDTRQRQEAFATYVLPEVGVLLRVARSRTARGVDAEDLVQDTLMRAYQGIDRFDGTYPRAWLLTIMRNTQINNVRRRRPELLDDQDVAFDRLVANEGIGGGGPEAHVVENTFDTVLSDALAALPPHFRDVVTLVDVDGLTYAEAAVILSIPLGTAVSRLHRARTRMRRRLQDAGIGPRGGRAE